MLAAKVRFNVGGTVSDVAVSTMKCKPEGLLTMIDGDPQMFRIVLDGKHRDNKVYPLPPGLEVNGGRNIESSGSAGVLRRAGLSRWKLSPRSMFRIVLDGMHRDTKVYPLPPEPTCERGSAGVLQHAFHL